jgi:hypothetical protein
MIDQETAKLMLKILEHIRKRPGMYFCDVLESPQSPIGDTVNISVNRAENFISGFNAALAAFGIFANNTIGYDQSKKQVIIERGWAFSPMPLRIQMRNRGMKDSEIIEELFAIEIETVKRRFNINNEGRGDHETDSR